MGGSKLLMIMSTDDISVLHSVEVIHFHHKSCLPILYEFARPLNTSFGEWRGSHYELFTKTHRKLTPFIPNVLTQKSRQTDLQAPRMLGLERSNSLCCTEPDRRTYGALGVPVNLTYN